MKKLDEAIKFVSESWSKSECRSQSTLVSIIEQAAQKYNISSFSIAYSLGVA